VESQRDLLRETLHADAARPGPGEPGLWGEILEASETMSRNTLTTIRVRASGFRRPSPYLAFEDQLKDGGTLLGGRLTHGSARRQTQRW